MDEKTIMYILGGLGAIINILFQRQIRINEETIKELKKKNDHYDATILKFNEKYSVMANDIKNSVKMSDMKFEQIRSDYADIKQNFKEIKEELKELINSKNERNN